jgi:hypothetical protein
VCIPLVTYLQVLKQFLVKGMHERWLASFPVIDEALDLLDKIKVAAAEFFPAYECVINAVDAPKTAAGTYAVGRYAHMLIAVYRGHYQDRENDDASALETTSSDHQRGAYQACHNLIDHGHPSHSILKCENGIYGNVDHSLSPRLAALMDLLEERNRKLLLADSSLMLLRSWKRFVNICLYAYPLGLSIGAQGSLQISHVPWRYLSKISAQLKAQLLKLQGLRLGNEIRLESLIVTQHSIRDLAEMVSIFLCFFINGGGAGNAMDESAAPNTPGGAAGQGGVRAGEAFQNRDDGEQLLAESILVDKHRSGAKGESQREKLSLYVDRSSTLHALVVDSITLAHECYIAMQSFEGGREGLGDAPFTTASATNKSFLGNNGDNSLFLDDDMQQPSAAGVPSAGMESQPLLADAGVVWMSTMSTLFVGSSLLVKWTTKLIQLEPLVDFDSDTVITPATPRFDSASQTASMRGGTPKTRGKSGKMDFVTPGPSQGRDDPMDAARRGLSSTCRQGMRVMCACLMEDDAISGGERSGDPQASAGNRDLLTIGLTFIPLALDAMQTAAATIRVQGVRVGDEDSLSENQKLLDKLRLVVDEIYKSGLVQCLLTTFASCGAQRARLANHILLLFLSLSQKPRGAYYLKSSLLVRYLCSHSMLNSYVSRASPPSAGPSGRGSGGPSMPHKTRKTRASLISQPYGIDSQRNLWHIVWCRVLALMTNIQRELGNTHKFLEDSVEFLTVYRANILDCISLTSSSDLTLGRLEEVRHAVSLLSEMERFGTEWRHRLPDVSPRHRRAIMDLMKWYVDLLNHPKFMARRARAVSPAEISGLDTESEFRGISVGGYKKKEQQATTYKVSGLDWTHIGGGNGTSGGSTHTAPIASFRAEGRVPASWDKSKASEPRTSTASHSRLPPGEDQRPLQISVSPTERIELAEWKLDEDELPPELPSVVRGDSFLLSDNAIVNMRANSMESMKKANRLGLSMERKHSITLVDSTAQHSASSILPSAVRKRQNFDHFSQRIEYAICLVLRNCLVYLRLLTRHYVDLQRSMADQDVLFSPEVKVVDLSAINLNPQDASTRPQYSTTRNSPKPPIAMIVDLKRYCLRVLTKLTDIRTTQTEKLALALAKQRVNTDFLGEGNGINLTSSVQLFTFLAENASYVLLQHIQFFMGKCIRPYYVDCVKHTDLMSMNQDMAFAASQRNTLEHMAMVDQTNKIELISHFREQMCNVVEWLSAFKAKQREVREGGTKPGVERKSGSAALVPASSKYGNDFMDIVLLQFTRISESLTEMDQDIKRRMRDSTFDLY